MGLKQFTKPSTAGSTNMRLIIFVLCVTFVMGKRIPFLKDGTMYQPAQARTKYQKMASFPKPNPGLRAGTFNKDPTENPDMFEGDINLNQEQVHEVEESTVTRNGITVTSYQWPNHHFPYTIHSSLSSRADFIKQSMEDFNTRLGGCITLAERTNEEHYVEFSNLDNGCWSSLGYGGRAEQTIQLSDPGCIWQGTIQHEVIHALGILHEQARENRDEFITVHWENIADGMESQFTKVSAPDFSAYNIPYNYYSVMHYPDWGFSANGEPTMTPKDPNVPSSALGNIDYAHALDIAKLMAMYGCDDTTAPGITVAPETTQAPTNNTGVCGSPNWKGDKFCDMENNNAGCEYDGGDCCLPAEESIGCCTDGECGQNDCICLECMALHWIGDNWCDAENNLEHCQFDGGDCCPPGANACCSEGVCFIEHDGCGCKEWP